jgi:hypothetical protein
MADLKDASAEHNCARVLYNLNEKIKEVKDSEKSRVNQMLYFIDHIEVPIT